MTDPELDAFYAEVGHHDLQPLWTQAKDLMPREPRPATLAHRWRGVDLRRLAERSGQLITIDRGGDRRVLALANPGLDGAPFAAATLWAAVQFLGPHEQAPAHRHAQSALRFVLEGRGVWTTVDGDAVDMEPGDVVFTPAHHWHDHRNGGADPMLWFDGLDIPLVSSLDASFFEIHPSDELQSVPWPHNRTERRNGRPGLRPVGPSVGNDEPSSSLLVHRWAHTDALLDDLLAEGGGDAAVEMVDPVTGGPVLPTLSAGVHRIAAGRSTVAQRQVGHRVVVVFRGSGSSTVGEVEFDWEPGDIFVLPSWATVVHRARDRADLFVLGDDPALRALGLFRSEVLG